MPVSPARKLEQFAPLRLRDWLSVTAMPVGAEVDAELKRDAD
jgi:hypothetical protein